MSSEKGGVQWGPILSGMAAMILAGVGVVKHCQEPQGEAHAAAPEPKPEPKPEPNGNVVKEAHEPAKQVPPPPLPSTSASTGGNLHYVKLGENKICDLLELALPKLDGWKADQRWANGEAARTVVFHLKQFKPDRGDGCAIVIDSKLSLADAYKLRKWWDEYRPPGYSHAQVVVVDMFEPLAALAR